MTSQPDQFSDLRGEQLPRISWCPPYARSGGAEATQLAADCGLVLDEWQRWVLERMLGVGANGKWVAFSCGLVVGRQNGKNAVLEARELYELFVVPQFAGPRTIIHSAHLRKTALEHFRRMKARIKANPDLLAKVKGPIRKGIPAGFRESHGEESIELEDGSRLLFEARTSSGGQVRGFTIDLVVFDESMNLPDTVVGSVVPALSARTGLEFLPGPQTVYTGSAVNQATMPNGVQLARLRERGIEGGDPALFYAEWGVNEKEFLSHPEWIDDPRKWAEANPGMGIRITVDHIWNERRGAMPPDEFLVERMGIGDWPPTSPDSARVISQAAWSAISDLGSQIAKTRVFGLAVDPFQAWATLAVAGAREDGLWHFEVDRHEAGLAWVVEHCKARLSEFPGSVFVVDPRDDLADILNELDAAGMRPVRTASHEYKDACGGFHRAVVEQTARYRPPQVELDSAVAGARTESLLNAWKWSYRGSKSLITPLVASTLALWGARTQSAPQIHNLNEIAAQLSPPEPEDPDVVAGAVRFVPL